MRPTWEQTHVLAGQRWSSQQSLYFDVPFQERIAQSLYLRTRYVSDFPYRNLHISYTLSDAEGEVLREGMRNIALFDAKSGRPLGSGSSGVWIKEDKLLDIDSLSENKQYQLVVQQFMRLDTLRGIRAIGLLLAPRPVDP